MVLNLVTPAHVAAVRERIDDEAAAAGRAPPRLAVWVPAALTPGAAAQAQLAGQLAAYLGAPGYGELFAQLGFAPSTAEDPAGRRVLEALARMP